MRKKGGAPDAAKSTAVQCNPAAEHEIRSGPLARPTIGINGTFRIDGVELHRDSSTGRAFLRFPAWIDAFGQRHSIVRPTTREVRAEILRQILAVLDAGFPNPNLKESP